MTYVVAEVTSGSCMSFWHGVQTIRCKQKIRSFAIAPSQSGRGGVSLTIALVNNSLEV